MKTLVIGDSNVFIDVIEAAIEEQFLRLPFRIATPDIVFRQELEPNHENLIDLGLELLVLDPPTIDLVSQLVLIYRKPSRIDITALALALTERAVLLTGDADLRSAAEHEGVEVHGTLWVVEELVGSGLVPADSVSRHYDLMRKAGRRLPWHEVEVQVRRLQKDTCE